MTKVEWFCPTVVGSSLGFGLDSHPSVRRGCVGFGHGMLYSPTPPENGGALILLRVGLQARTAGMQLLW